jgi:hypothetical protein
MEDMSVGMDTDLTPIAREQIKASGADFRPHSHRIVV